jgi:hypothetical protein
MTRHARAPEGDVRDTPVVGMLHSTAVRRANGDILRILHARSTAAAKRHLSRLTERVAAAAAEAAVAVTAVQELHGIDLIHVTDFHYLLDRLAVARATGGAGRKTLMESRLVPDRHLRGASDPAVVSRLATKACGVGIHRVRRIGSARLDAAVRLRTVFGVGARATRRRAEG